jgi:hypothetical protein
VTRKLSVSLCVFVRRFNTAYNFVSGPTQMLPVCKTENVEEFSQRKCWFCGSYIHSLDHVNSINTINKLFYNHGNVPRYKFIDDKLVQTALQQRFLNFIFDPQMVKKICGFSISVIRSILPRKTMS